MKALLTASGIRSFDQSIGISKIHGSAAHLAGKHRVQWNAPVTNDPQVVCNGIRHVELDGRLALLLFSWRSPRSMNR